MPASNPKNISVCFILFSNDQFQRRPVKRQKSNHRPEDCSAYLGRDRTSSMVAINRAASHPVRASHSATSSSGIESLLIAGIAMMGLLCFFAISTSMSTQSRALRISYTPASRTTTCTGMIWLSRELRMNRPPASVFGLIAGSCQGRLKLRHRSPGILSISSENLVQSS